MALKFPREFYVPKGSAKVTHKASGAVIYVKAEPKPHAVGFFGNAQKPTFNFTFKTPERMEVYVRSRLADFEQLAQRRALRKAERKADLAKPHNVKVGDIYRTSWGYDQTNVEFFEVVEVKGKFAILREVEQAVESGGHGQDRVVPQSGKYLKPRYEGDDQGLPIRRLIQPGHIKICDVRNAWPWGTREPITGTVIGKAAYATSPGWGH